MGAALSNAFIPPDSIMGCSEEDGVVSCLPPFSSAEWAWGMFQTLSLMAVYAYILFSASNTLSEGSELLLLVPSLAGVVGSVVLPILGAIPGRYHHRHPFLPQYHRPLHPHTLHIDTLLRQTGRSCSSPA